MTEPVVHEAHARIGHESGRTPERLLVVGLVLLLVLVIKPWGPTPEVATAPGPVASVAPTPRELTFAELPCQGRMWLVEADTRWAGQVVRSWILTDAVTATDPPIGSINFVVVAAQQVLAIGYCPSYRDDTRPHDRVTIYRLTPSTGPPGPGVTIAEVATTPVRVPQEADAAANDLFAPLSTPGPSGSSKQISWGPGRYVMRIAGPDGYLRWLGLEIRLIGAGSLDPEGSVAP
jgi:hypothetical protein